MGVEPYVIAIHPFDRGPTVTAHHLSTLQRSYVTSAHLLDELSLVGRRIPVLSADADVRSAAQTGSAGRIEFTNCCALLRPFERW